jgi:hypothetical protein
MGEAIEKKGGYEDEYYTKRQTRRKTLKAIDLQSTLQPFGEL